MNPAARSARLPPGAHAGSALSGRRVLVVEDEALIALDLAAVLRECDAKLIGPVSSPEEALRHIARARIDCATLDVRLGDDDCMAVADALSSRGVPFVFVTGFKTNPVLSRHSGWPVFQKPYTSIDVVKGLESLLAPAARAGSATSGLDGDSAINP